MKAAFLLYDRALFSGICRPYEIFMAINTMARLERKPPYLDLFLAKVDDAEPQVAADLPVKVEHTIDTLGNVDWIFLPPTWRNPVSLLKRYDALFDWLKQRHEQGATIIATGTGAYFPAEAGLLDGQAATTHWYFFDHFERRYPRVELKQQHFITYAENIYCAGSINALSDLIFHLIGQHFGEHLRQDAQRHFVHEIGSTYEVPMYTMGKGAHADEAIVNVQEWLKQHWMEEIDIPEMAAQASMPIRTFTRRFKHALGVTPNQYLQDIRIENGRELLKMTDLSIQDISVQVGYADTAYFSRVFKAKVGLTPTEYRKLVRAKLFQVSSE